MTFNQLLLQPLGPALVMALGGLVLGLSHGISFGPALRAGVVENTALQAQIRRVRLALLLRSAFAWLVVLGTIGELALLRLLPLRGDVSWDWQPLTVAGGVLEWHMDGWNWLAGLLIVLLTAAVLGLSEFRPASVVGRPAAFTHSTLLFGAAALAFVFSANVVTLMSAWVLLDAALVMRLHPSESAQPSARAWGLLSITGLLLLVALVTLGEKGIRARLIGDGFGGLDLALLWLAALIRAGVYPLHFWLMGADRTDAGDRAALHLIGPMAGLWLLARVHHLSGPDWFRRPEWAALGALALLGTAIAAWTAEEQGLRWRWIAMNRASLVVLAAYTAALAGPAALVWSVITFALGSALLAVSQVGRTRYGWRLLPWLSALAMWGLPGTPGFLARSVLVFPTELPIAIPLFTLILVAEVLFVASLWQAVTARHSPGDLRQDTASPLARATAPPAWFTMGQLVLIAALLALPLLFLGLFPQRVARLLSPEAAGSLATSSWDLAHVRRSVWIGLGLSSVAGVSLGLLRDRIFSAMRGWQHLLYEVVNLEWFYRGIATIFALLSSFLRYFASLGEGEGYVGWVILASFVLWVLLRL